MEGKLCLPEQSIYMLFVEMEKDELGARTRARARHCHSHDAIACSPGCSGCSHCFKTPFGREVLNADNATSSERKVM